MSELYLRYYAGHKGQFGHEFIEFEVRADGRLRYTNNSQYKSDQVIKKEVWLGPALLEKMKEMLHASGIVRQSDKTWPVPDDSGKQELEVVLGETAVSLVTSKIGSLSEISKTRDPKTLTEFYYMVQDLKSFIFSIINIHFRVKPI